MLNKSNKEGIKTRNVFTTDIKKTLQRQMFAIKSLSKEVKRFSDHG